MIRLRLAFMGTPAFAAQVLAALLDRGHELAAVYCRPPRPAGRGNRPQASPVQELAERRGLALHMPERLDAATAAAFASLGLDAAVVAAYGLILPKAILAAPRLGFLNVHASLLPRWRGAAPIERALLAGDSETGVTIMQIDEGLDTGPVLICERVPIGPETTAPALYDRLARLGSELVLTALEALAAGRLVPRPQPPAGATYAPKLRREEGRLDWRHSAALLERQVRALNPAPGVWFEHGGERIKVLAAGCEEDGAGALPGTVLDSRLRIGCGRGVFQPRLLQRAGRSPLAPPEFLRGFPIPPGTMLPCPATS